MENTILEKMTVCNAMGLHARPAAQLVHIAGKFQSAVSMRKCGSSAWSDCRSVLALLMLAASCGTELEVQTSGCDAREAMDAIGSYFKDKFGEN